MVPAPPAPRVTEPPSRAPVAISSAAPARLLIDVTGVIKRDAGTGIQRVVKKVVEAIYRDGDYQIPVLAARALDGRLYTAHEYAASLLGQPPRAADAEIEPLPGDRFLMLSDSWNAFEELAPLFARIREKGGEIVSCVFDLIPELYPHACHDVTVPLYDAWLRKALVESDGFLAISRTVAREFAAFVAARGLPHPKRPQDRLVSLRQRHGARDAKPAARKNPGRRRGRDAGVPLRLDARTAQGPAHGVRL